MDRAKASYVCAISKNGVMTNPTAPNPLDSGTTKPHRITFALSVEQLDLLDAAAVRLGGWSRSQLIRYATLNAARGIVASPAFSPDGLLAGLVPPAAALDPDDATARR